MTCLPNKFMCLMFLQSGSSLGETCIHFLPACIKAHGGRPGEVVAGKRLHLFLHILLDVNVKGGGFVGVDLGWMANLKLIDKQGKELVELKLQVLA